MGLTHGIHTISLYDHQGDNEVVQLNALVPDQTTFNLRQQNEGPTTPQGNRYNAGLMSEGDFVFLDVDGVAGSIETWQSNDTPVRLAAAGENKNILWEEDTIPNIQPVEIEGAVGGRSDAYRVRMTHRTGRGDTHDIYGLANLLAKLGTRADPWIDDDANGSADGYTINGESSKSFSTNEQSITTQSNGTVAEILTEVTFPISDENLIASSNLVSLHSDDDVIRYEVLDSSNSILQFSKKTITSGGRKSISFTTPSQIYSIKFYAHRVVGPQASETVKTKFPAIRTDSSDQYING